MFDNDTNLGTIGNVLKVDVNLQKLVLKIEHLEEENSEIESKCIIVETKSKSVECIWWIRIKVLSNIYNYEFKNFLYYCWVQQYFVIPHSRTKGPKKGKF